jgi:glutathione S-transferase
MTKPSTPIRLYQFPGSGNCHRARVFLSILGLPVELINLDRAANQHKDPAFMAKNPFGQVPLIEDGDVRLADSTAILVYLAKRYDDSGRWLPADAVGAAEVQRWLSVATGELTSGPLVLRRIKRMGIGDDDPVRAKAISDRLCALLDSHLTNRSFLVGDGPTIADLALYTYIALAPESGYPLDAWPQLLAWLKRVEALPGFIPV